MKIYRKNSNVSPWVKIVVPIILLLFIVFAFWYYSFKKLVVKIGDTEVEDVTIITRDRNGKLRVFTKEDKNGILFDGGNLQIKINNKIIELENGKKLELVADGTYTITADTADTADAADTADTKEIFGRIDELTVTMQSEGVRTELKDKIYAIKVSDDSTNEITLYSVYAYDGRKYRRRALLRKENIWLNGETFELKRDKTIYFNYETGYYYIDNLSNVFK